MPADDKLDQVFKKYDKNKSGTMNAEELEPAYAELQKLLQAGTRTTHVVCMQCVCMRLIPYC